MSLEVKDFQVLGTIGKGTFGCCKKIRRRKDGKILVWKEVTYGSMSETEKQLIVSEVNLLGSLRHRHIVRYYDRIVDRNSSAIYIIMEFCEGGDLSSMIDKWKRQKTGPPEDFIWRILAQLCQALQVCHGRRTTGKAVIHRDLKPANVFLDADQNVKLGDFGLARVLTTKNNMAKTFVGTPYYMSPEQVMFEAYNEKSDIWSLGCLTYEMAALHPPFLARNQSELAVKIKKGRFARIPKQYSNSLQSVIEDMLQVNEHRRPNIEHLIGLPEIKRHTTPDVKNISGGSTSSKENNSQRRESVNKEKDKTELRKWEMALLEKEKHLMKKESEIKRRERNVLKYEEELTDRVQRMECAQKFAEEREWRVNQKIVCDTSNGPMAIDRSILRKRRIISIGGPIQSSAADILNRSPRLRTVLNSNRRSSVLSPVFQLI